MAVKLDDGSEVVTGNTYDKFRTTNPIARWMQGKFLTAARELLGAVTEAAPPRRVFEVGCGPGDLAAAIVPSRWPYVGSDIGLQEILSLRRHGPPSASGLVASAYQLPVPDDQVDLLLACEVLEHLEHPARALEEIARVCSGYVLVSVPWEPTWRMMNLLRGAYLSDWGNTPGHVQHFSRAAIRSLVEQHFDILAERRPLPWTMLLAQARNA